MPNASTQRHQPDRGPGIRQRVLAELAAAKRAIATIEQLLASTPTKAVARPMAPRRGGFRGSRPAQRAFHSAAPTPAAFPNPCRSCAPYCGPNCPCSCHSQGARP